MAKLQAKSVGGTEDYVVTREFKGLAETPTCRGRRACFAVMAANGTISAEETGTATRSPMSSTSTTTSFAAIRAEYHEMFHRSSRSGASPWFLTAAP